METKKRRRSFTWTLKPVLPKSLTADTVDTVNVFVDTIVDRTCISRIVKSLAELSAIAPLTHLKRVSNRTVILMMADGQSPDGCVAELTSRGFDFNGLSGRPEVVAVPGAMPKTCAQNRRARELWPCNFHPDKRLESVLACEFFDHLQLAAIEGHMRTALGCAATAGGVGAVVVDPRTNQTVAQSGDFRYFPYSFNALFYARFIPMGPNETVDLLVFTTGC